MDRYSKIVLTVIAVALSIQVLQNAGVWQTVPRGGVVSAAIAQQPAPSPMKVQICAEPDAYGKYDCAKVHYGKLPISSAE